MPSLISRAQRFLVRSVVRAVGQESVVNSLFPSWQTGPRLGASQMLAAYSTMPWLRAVNQKISHDVSTLTWQLYVPTTKRGNGKVVAFRDFALQRAARREARTEILRKYAKQQQLREIVNHPLLDMLTSGNNWFSGMTSLQVAQVHLDLVGETAWILETNGYGMPTTFVPIPPTWVAGLPGETGGTYRVIGPGSTYDIPADKFFWAYHPNPSNPFRRGIGLGQTLADELETDEFASRHVKDWFRNRAIPPVLISGLGVGLPELQRLEEKWLSKFSRVGAGWLPHFIGRKVDVHQLSQTFEQQQLGTLREQQRNTIHQVYGVPPEQMGIVKDSNRATIEASDYIYDSRVIVPRAEFLRAAMQERLVPLFDDRLVLDYVSPVQQDREFALKVRMAAPWAWSADDWREFGLSDPLEGDRGKVHALPFSLTLVRNLGAQADTDALPPPAPIIAPPALPPAPAPKALRGRTEKDLTDDEIERIMASVRADVLTAAGRPVIRSLIGKFGQDAADEAAIEIEFDLSDARVVEHLREFGADRMSDLVNETTKRAIGRQLSEGVEAGETFDDLKTRIQDVFAVASDSRAALIARSEVTRSSAFATTEGLRAAGFEERAWLSTQDASVRDGAEASHVALDGQVVGIDEDFIDPVSKASGPYPGGFGDPAEDCGCRCAVVSVLAQRSNARLTQWKSMEAARAPYVRRLRTALAGAFRTQERAALSALTSALKSSAGSTTVNVTLPEVYVDVRPQFRMPAAEKAVPPPTSVTKHVARDDRGRIVSIREERAG